VCYGLNSNIYVNHSNLLFRVKFQDKILIYKFNVLVKQRKVKKKKTKINQNKNKKFVVHITNMES
jgi:hypothetical protein